MTKNNYKPILFNTVMVQAILAGNKTQTRRLLTPQPYKEDDWLCDTNEEPIKLATFIRHPKKGKYDGIFLGDAPKLWPAKYQVGDILWVRETWKVSPEQCTWLKYSYKADYPTVLSELGKWKPSIHMPREAARIFLKITNVRCERIAEISCKDCKKEGVTYHKHKNKDVDDFLALEAFMELWETINGAESWNQNPYVFAYDFVVIQKPADF